MTTPFETTDERVLAALETSIQSFLQTRDYPTELILDHAYVFGSRGDQTADEDSDLDILLCITTPDESISEGVLEKVCGDLQMHILWEHTEQILDATGLPLEPTKQNLDVVAYPDGVAQHQLDTYMEHGGYQNAYSITNNQYLY